jgi:hypothetical protein
MEDNKKATAAISAVMNYIQTEEEAVRMQAAMAMGPYIPTAAAAPTGGFKPWSISGRQTQMQLRNLMQLRTFQRKAL